MQYPFYGYNPMMAGQQAQKRIADLQNELNALQQMNNQMYSQTPSNSSSPLNNDTGIYVYAQDYQQVVSYPTPADGKATLFINLDKGIGWSKKFVNGTNVIQSFTISFLNGYDNSNVQPNNVTESLPSDTNNDILENLMQRMTQMEDNFEKVLNTLNGKVQNNAIQSKANNQRSQSNSQSSTSR